MRTTVTELPGSRVRVDVEVSAEELERRLQQRAQSLGRNLRIPGFRKGKVPAPLVIQRLGRATVFEETLRESLGRWYAEAIDAAAIAPIGDPDINVGALAEEGQPLTFTIEIAVRPAARLGRYRELEVGRREPAADEEAIDQELESLRERMAKLDPSEEPAADGDFVVIDYVGSIDGVSFDGGEARDQLVELAPGRLIPGFAEGLTGAKTGEQRTLALTFPDDYSNQELAGKQASFDVTVKAVQRKRLPELDDDFAAEAGFDTLQELHEDIRKRLLELDERRVAEEFREAALDAAVAEATVDVTPELARARALERFENALHSLSHQGISKDAYLRITGKSEEQTLAEMEPDAELALRREAVIAAVVQAEGIEIDDDELLAALEQPAAREDTTAKKLMQQLRSAGRLEQAREELAAQRAIDAIADSATPIGVEQARAREVLWTPEKAERARAGERPAGAGEERPGGLWTPGS